MNYQAAWKTKDIHLFLGSAGQALPPWEPAGGEVLSESHLSMGIGLISHQVRTAQSKSAENSSVAPPCSFHREVGKEGAVHLPCPGNPENRELMVEKTWEGHREKTVYGEIPSGTSPGQGLAVPYSLGRRRDDQRGYLVSFPGRELS